MQNLDRLFGFADLRTCPMFAVQVVVATRLTILFARADRDPLPDLAVRLRSMRAAQGIAQLVMSIEQSWPEPFAIHRPCCVGMTPDEALLAEVCVAAAQGNRRAATATMRDLLPPFVRERLFQNAVELVDAVRAVDAGEVKAGTGPSADRV